MSTKNPVPSTDPTDIVFNSQKLDEVVNGNLHYYTDRLGVSRRTVEGINAAADVVLAGLGYAPPVAYASGILLTLTTQTVEYSGLVYAPKAADLPFTTSGTFETAKFRPIQGVSSADLAASGGASMVGYIQAGTGAVATTVQAKLHESVSVSGFETVQEAVAHAYLNNVPLYWPSLIEVSSNIPNFHAVRHYGPGGVVRGTDTFHIEPDDTQTNTVYVSSSGSDSNDGLSSDHPIRTLSKCKSILVNTRADQRGGTWRIKFAAGNYSDSTNFPDLPIFRNAIQFIGSGTSRTPLTIFDGASAVYKTAGMYFMNRTNVYCQYLKFINFTQGYGILAERNCQLEIEDCVAENCSIGFSAGYSSFIRTTRCAAINCTGTGFRVASNGQASFVPKTGLIADSNRAIGCGYGFTVTRNSYAHIDYNEIEDSTYAGIIIEINSRSAALGNNLKRNPVAIRCWTSGYVSYTETDPNILNENTVDANGTTYEYRGSSGDVSLRGQSATMDSSVFRDTTERTFTGDLIPDQVGGTLFTAPAGWFVDSRKRLKCTVWGTATTLTDGTISIQVRMGTTGLSQLSIPSNLTDVAFRLDFECVATSGNTQKSFSTLQCGNNVTATELQKDTINFQTGDRSFTLWVDANGSGGAGSSITIESVEFVVCG